MTGDPGTRTARTSVPLVVGNGGVTEAVGHALVPALRAPVGVLGVELTERVGPP